MKRRSLLRAARYGGQARACGRLGHKCRPHGGFGSFGCFTGVNGARPHGAHGGFLRRSAGFSVSDSAGHPKALKTPQKTGHYAQSNRVCPAACPPQRLGRDGGSAISSFISHHQAARAANRRFPPQNAIFCKKSTKIIENYLDRGLHRCYIRFRQRKTALCFSVRDHSLLQW